MFVTTTNENRGHKIEKRVRVMYGKVWRAEKERRSEASML